MYTNKNSWCFKFDITSAYHHIDIFPDHRKYLGFSWKFGVQDRYFCFNVLPFGLTSAPYIFTKLTRPLVKKWRREDKTVLMYLDDGFGCHSKYDDACKISKEVRYDLVCSGFVPKVEKSMWIPCQVIEYLGVVLDCNMGKIYIPEKRVFKIQKTILKIEHFMNQNCRIKVRRLASLVGQIISMSVVIGSVAQLMTKSLSIDIVSAPTWNSMVLISEESKKQISFWKSS